MISVDNRDVKSRSMNLSLSDKAFFNSRQKDSPSTNDGACVQLKLERLFSTIM